MSEAQAVVLTNPTSAQTGQAVAQSNMMVPYTQQMPAARERLHWSDEEIQVIKNSLVAGAPDPVFRYYLAAASVMGLNPLLKEIYIVPYGDESRGVKWVLQTGIDGFIRHAWESGRFNGFAGTSFVVKDKEGNLSEVSMKMYDPDAGLTIVSCTVLLNVIGRADPIEATCHFKRYAKTNDKTGELQASWGKFPERMIEKCCQAKGIRENFPGRSGVYIPEEMGNLDETDGFVFEGTGNSAKALPPRTRQRRLQKPLAPLSPVNDDVIDTTATVVEEMQESQQESATESEQTAETSEQPSEDVQQKASAPTEADGDPGVVAYLKKVTDGMTGVYKIPPDGIHHMNRLIRNQFEVDEPWMIPGERLEELQKYCKKQLLEDMQAGEWIPARGSK